ncbi:hypothetical protein BDR03DRAFT_964575 [Suillus americanus]|nr:hypothetical protein BDR03DRAFT_964575 [Suillus americanus]
MSTGPAKHLDEYYLAFYLASLVWSSAASSIGLLCPALFGSFSILMELGDNCQQLFVVERYRWSGVSATVCLRVASKAKW